MDKNRCRRIREVSRLKINVIKKSGKELKIEIEGTGHGFCNLLQKRLLDDKNVDMAGYDIPHPLASNPVIYIRMKGSAKPEDALKKAAEKARESNQTFSEAFQKALKV